MVLGSVVVLQRDTHSTASQPEYGLVVFVRNSGKPPKVLSFELALMTKAGRFLPTFPFSDPKFFGLFAKTPVKTLGHRGYHASVRAPLL